MRTILAFALPAVLSVTAALAAPPTVSLSTSPESPVTSGTPVSVLWTVDNLADHCFASSSPLVPRWSGMRNPAGGSSVFTPRHTDEDTPLVLDLTMRCYNADGRGQQTIQLTVDGVAPPTGGCNVTTSDPLFQPAGWTRVERTWAQLWNGTSYPTGVTGEPWPVGAWTINNSSMSNTNSLTGRYISVPFVGNGSAYQLNWIQAKPVALYGYGPARFTDHMYVTISTCPGDFRLAGAFQFESPDPTNDPTFVKQCRNLVISETSIFYGPTGSNTVCEVAAGQQYWLNVIFANPTDGLSPSESGCRTPGYCETSWRHLVN